MGLPHSDAESVFFAPKLYAILREGEKTIRKIKFFTEYLNKNRDFKAV